MQLNILKCYALAWKGFSKWWIPICLISGGILAFELLPKLLANEQLMAYLVAGWNFFRAAFNGNLGAMQRSSDQLQRAGAELARQTMLYSAYLFPAVALLTVILLMIANWAVKDRRTKGNSALWLAYVAVVHVVLSILKIGAMFLFIVPGAYLYVRLLFVSLVMIELKKGPFAAIATSWRMTRGNFWPLLLLFLINSTVQFVALLTILGEIPTTGFVNTARAAAFRMLLDGDLPVLTPVDAQ